MKGFLNALIAMQYFKTKTWILYFLTSACHVFSLLLTILVFLTSGPLSCVLRVLVEYMSKLSFHNYFYLISFFFLQAYGFGLLITFVALILMKEGQPALLYLAPSVLIACTIVGYTRGELKSLWRGRVVSSSIVIIVCFNVSVWAEICAHKL